jgi:hypothetical protein
MTTLIARKSTPAAPDGLGQIAVTWKSSSPASSEFQQWDERIRGVVPQTPSMQAFVKPSSEKPLAAQLFDKFVELSIESSRVSMHLDRKWRDGLFKQLAIILSEDEWDRDDKLPDRGSFLTFLRATIFWRFSEPPGLGMSAMGNVVLAWTRDDRRLTVECLPRDEVKWVLSRTFEEERETAGGRTTLTRLRDVVSPYNFDEWLFDGQV